MQKQVYQQMIINGIQALPQDALVWQKYLYIHKVFKMKSVSLYRQLNCIH